MNPPIRFHHLKTIGTKSPAHLREVWDHGEVQAESAAMGLGSAVHHLVFNTKRVITYPGAVRRGKAWDEFQLEHADDWVVSRSDYERANRMVGSLDVNKDAVRLLSGVCESPINWTLNGRACRSTPDARSDGFVTDLKTCQSSQPDKFMHQALRLNYPASLAWYQEAIRASGEDDPKEAYIVAVESTAPYPVQIFKLTERALDKGHQLWRMWFEQLRACEESNAWPAYCQAIVDFDVPEELELQFAEDDLEAA